MLVFGNHTHKSLQNENWLIIHEVILYAILFFSILGNLIFITSLYLRTSSINILDKLMVHSVFCSSLLVISSIPPHFVMTHAKHYPFGEIGCKIINPLSTYALNTSGFIYIVIAIERWLVVSRIKFLPPTKSKELLIFVAIHFFGIATVIPYMVASSIEGAPPKCIESWSPFLNQLYTVCLFFIQYGIPVIVMFIFYIKAWRILKKSQYFIATFSELGVQFIRTTRFVGRNSAVGRRHNQYRHILIKFTVIVLVFSICMLPHQILWYVIGFHEEGNEDSHTILSQITYIITYSNCVINPWLYGKFDRHFRNCVLRKLKSLTFRRCCKHAETVAEKEEQREEEQQKISLSTSDRKFLCTTFS